MTARALRWLPPGGRQGVWPAWAMGLAVAAACASARDSSSAPEEDGATLQTPKHPPATLDAVVDLHLDTVTAALQRNESMGDGPHLEASLAVAGAHGATVLVEALWIPRPSQVRDPRAHFLSLFGKLETDVGAAPGWAIARAPAEVRRRLQEGARSVVVALESASAFTAGPDDLDRAFARGLRMVGPSWTASNEFADSSAEPRVPGGLTAAGRALVRRANDLGVLVDVSHLSDRALADVLDTSRAPVVASHSNARALCETPRNLTDDQARRIARAGGLVAVMFHAPFVCDVAPEGGDGVTGPDDVAAHVAHLLRVAGPGHVGIGSDWDGGIQPARGLSGWRDMAALVGALRRRGIQGETLRGVLGESFLTVWEQVEAAAGPGRSQ